MKSRPVQPSPADVAWMRHALRLARRGIGHTAPNPAVGAVLVRRGRLIGAGWHRRAGEPHAEIAALADAAQRGATAAGATLYVTLEPCSTHGRTPPCTNAVVAAGIRRVVYGATDPNPAHAGRARAILRRAGVEVVPGVLAEACAALNPGFDHWVVHGTPYVTLKAAMTLDGKIATAQGESRWITGAAARRHAMELRRRVDAILVGVNTVLLDDPALTVRLPAADARPRLRVVLDTLARTPPDCQLLTDAGRARTVIVVSRAAPAAQRRRLAERGQVWIAPRGSGGLDLRWVLRRLGVCGVTHVLVEGGGRVHAAFLHQHLAHAIAFFYAPKILGGADSRKAVAGAGAACRADLQRLTEVRWRRLGVDLLLTAQIRHAAGAE